MSNKLQENFEKALETIDTLSIQNQMLMDKIQDLKLKLASKSETPFPSNGSVQTESEKRHKEVNEIAEAAMKRYKQFLKKEFPHAKSKQTKRQPV